MNYIDRVCKTIKSDNNKQLLSNITGAFLIKGFALLINIFTMPAYMNYFREQRILGVWFTLLSILTWILTFDLGIGNGLRNHLVSAFVEDDNEKAKQYISSAYIMIGVVSLILITVGSIFIYFSNWNIILNINPTVISNKTLMYSVILVFSGIVIQFFLKLVLSIFNAMQKTALSNFIMLLSSVLILLYVIFFNSQNDETNLLNISAVYILTVNLPLLISTIVLFTGKLSYAAPSIKYYVHTYAKNVLMLGSKFFLVQVTFMIITSTNEMIITWLFGPRYVVEYQVYNKLFYTFVTLFSLISNPLWSAVTKAYAERNFNWIKKSYKLVNIIASIATVGCFGMIIILQYIINIWLRSNAIKVNYGFACVFAIFCSVMIFFFSISSIANGIGKLRPQLIGNTMAAIFKIPLCYVMSKFIGGWICIIFVNILILIPCVVWQYLVINKTLKCIE